MRAWARGRGLLRVRGLIMHAAIGFIGLAVFVYALGVWWYRARERNRQEAGSVGTVGSPPRPMSERIAEPPASVPLHVVNAPALTPAPLACETCAHYLPAKGSGRAARGAWCRHPSDVATPIARVEHPRPAWCPELAKDRDAREIAP